ncbi:MAG: hypothetical protein AB2696_21175 [Candidatus Thiodiazotropha sp.]
MPVIFDAGTVDERKTMLVQDYLDRYPESLIDALATSTAAIPSRIRFWMQTHQTINLYDDGRTINGKTVADYVLSQGMITQEQHDAILA